jgi:hypothetical protein
MDTSRPNVPENSGREADQKKGLAFYHTGSSTQSFDTMFGGMYGQQQKGSNTPCSSRRLAGGGADQQESSVSHGRELLHERDDSFVRNNNNAVEDEGYLSGGGYHSGGPSQSLAAAAAAAAGTRESRVVLVEGIDPNTPDSLLKKQFECFGDIHSITTETKTQGHVLIIYHDIRAARLAMHSSGSQWRGRQLTCAMLDENEYHFGLKAPPTRLYLVSLDGGRSIENIFYLLTSYGELKDLKKDPLKPHTCCIVEYFDSRHAAAAFSELKLVHGLADTLLVLDASVKEISGFDDVSSLQQSKHPYQTSYHTSLSDMTKNLSEISLESQYQGLSPPMLGDGANDSSDKLNGRTAFAPSQDTIWRNNSYGETSGLLAGSPPSGGSQWLSSNEVLAALQAQQRASLHLQAQNTAMQAALHKSMVSDHSYRPMIPRGQVARRNQSDPGFGGRLARSKMNPVAEAERKAQQDRMYGLNMNNILMGEDKRTTLMIKNIPNKYTQKMLLALLEERFAGTHPFPFDFFYLPIDFKNRCNVGYAFINMTTPLAIPALVEEFHGRRWPKFNSEKVCQIAYGRIQGKLSLIQHFQNSSLLHEDKKCRPVLFSMNGDVEPFPIGPAALANYSLKSRASEAGRNEPNGY